MSNEHLIKSAHVWAMVLLLFGAVVFATKAASNAFDPSQQNSNANSNTNTSGNQNQNQNQNENQNQNSNANANTANRNANNSNTTGDQAGMAALSSRDRNFVIDAAHSGMMEVELGRWAAQKGTSPEIKQFGQRMVEDHTRVNTELTQWASGKGITLPTAMDQKHQTNVSKVSRLTGAQFDRAYAKVMVNAHQKDVSAFEKQSTNGDDAELKAFAAKTLPTLQEHLQMARSLPGNAGRGGNSNGNGNSNSNSNSNGNSNSNSNQNNNGNSNRP